MTYHFDQALHLYRHLDGGDFSYSDGEESEGRLLAAVTSAKDRSTFSPELAASITDWVSEYHLSKSRHCLLRPLGIRAGNKVLELGCGCGAVTRYLGEIGADVVAVEGSLARAQIAAERCRELDNVRVVVDDLLRYTTDERFDFILLIGVLEYAPVYSNHGNPFEHYLRAVAHFLAPEGKLVIAIENELGLKYFNGCSEDHVGAPFFGVQDLYQPRKVRTFGRRGLIEQLSGAGLCNLEFYYPFPDYKLPAVILSEAALHDKQLDTTDLLARCHARDYTGYPFRSFDDALAISAIHDNDLLAELSNSFLVTATAEQSVASATAKLATSFSVHRAAEFCTQTSFARTGDSIRVHKEYLTDAPPHTIVLDDGLTIQHRLDESAYRPGRQLLWKLLKARARTGDPHDIVEALRPWMALLLQHAHLPAGQIADRGERPTPLAWYRLAGQFVDCTPFNVLETKDGLVEIDLEWTSDSEVPLGWVVARGVLHSLLAGVPSANNLGSNAEITKALCRQFGLSVSDAELEAWMEIEAQFQAGVMGAVTVKPTISMTSGRLRTWLSEIARLDQNLAERNDQIAGLHHALDARVRQLAELQEVLTLREQALAARDEALASRNEEIASLIQTIGGQQEEITSIREHFQHAQEEIAHTRKAVGDLERQLSAVQRQLGAIEASTSWKVISTLRSTFDAYPRFRRVMRRTLRIAHWTATFQLPRRIRARQNLLKERDLIAASSLFDGEWYLREYPDVATAGSDPALHYLLFGAGERRNPGPSFDAAWYLEHNTDVAASGCNPLLHYLRFGASEKREIKSVSE